MADPKAPTHEAAREIVRNAQLYTLSDERLGGLLRYIAAAKQTEKERDELNAKLERAEDRAKYERKLSDQCCQERDLAESRQKLAESTKDAEVAKWEVAFREERMRGAEYARLAAVLREHGAALLRAAETALYHLPNTPRDRRTGIALAPGSMEETADKIRAAVKAVEDARNVGTYEKS